MLCSKLQVSENYMHIRFTMRRQIQDKTYANVTKHVIYVPVFVPGIISTFNVNNWKMLHQVVLVTKLQVAYIDLR